MLAAAHIRQYGRLGRAYLWLQDAYLSLAARSIRAVDPWLNLICGRRAEIDGDRPQPAVRHRPQAHTGHPVAPPPPSFPMRQRTNGWSVRLVGSRDIL
jgi:hypothetical protein